MGRSNVSIIFCMLFTGSWKYKGKNDMSQSLNASSSTSGILQNSIPPPGSGDRRPTWPGSFAWHPIHQIRSVGCRPAPLYGKMSDTCGVGDHDRTTVRVTKQIYPVKSKMPAHMIDIVGHCRGSHRRFVRRTRRPPTAASGNANQRQMLGKRRQSSGQNDPNLPPSRTKRRKATAHLRRPCSSAQRR